MLPENWRHRFAFLAKPALLLLAMGTWNLVSLAYGTNPPRYLAKTMNGRQVTGKELTGWQGTPSAPTLDGQPILSGEGRLKWLVDRYAAPQERPTAFVEFVGGDRLPGRVTGYRSGTEQPLRKSPAHFLVESTAVRLETANVHPAELRVATRFVRRVVWRRQRLDRYVPNTVFLQNGGKLNFRAFRLAPDRVVVLLDDDQTSIPYSEIAELHLPATDDWALYFSALSVLCTEPDTVCQQIETDRGIRLTASFERFLASPTGAAAEPRNGLHGMQPAWSLDVLWVPQAQIAIRRFWQPTSVPLTQIRPLAVSTASPFGGDPLWRWSQDSTVTGAPLRSAKASFNWGFGCHGPTTFKFPLAAAAREFRSHAALDRPEFPVDVEAKLQVDGAQIGEVMRLSPESASVETRIQFPSAAGKPAHNLELTSRPTQPEGGAIGFQGIGSSMHWGDPVIELDRSLLDELLRTAAADQVEAWRGWQASLPEDAWRRNIHFSTPGRESFQLYFSASNTPIVLRRRAVLPKGAAWLVIDATRATSEGPAPVVEVQCGDQPALRFDILPEGSAASREPIAISLAKIPRDQPALIEIRHLPGTPGAGVLWHAIRISETQ